MTTINNVINDAIENFKEALQYMDDNERHDFIEQDEPHDLIFETSDGAVPIYTTDILECAVSDLYLATEEPELGPAFDGSPTPVNIIAANIFEAINNALWEWWYDNKDKMLEELTKDE